KGRIAVGADADLALVDLGGSFVLAADDLLYRHRQSPYVGRRFAGRVVRTVLRGTTGFHEGQLVAGAIGDLLHPERLAGSRPRAKEPEQSSCDSLDKS